MGMEQVYFQQGQTCQASRANLVGASLDVLGGEVGQLLEVRVLGPHGLGDHLGQLHGCQGGAQPAVTGQHVHAGLDQTHRL